MTKPYTILLLLLSLHCVLSISSIYVSPTATCPPGCDGSLSLPYNNIFNAFKKASTLSSAQIILMGSSSASHYLIEDLSTMTYNSATWTYIGPTSYFNTANLAIKPLFCTEAPALGDPTLQTQCINLNQKATVYLKTTNFIVYIQSTMTVQNVIFDAIEDIKTWNPTINSDVTDCLQSQKKCCQVGVPISPLYPTSVACGWKSTDTRTWTGTTNSIFELTNNNIPTPLPRSFSSVFIEINNFQTPYLRSFVEVGPQTFLITISQTLMNNILFNNGLISSTSPDSPALSASTLTNVSSITITNCLFTNYNIWNIQMQTSLRYEGYLFYASNTFQGLFKVLQSKFFNTVSSLRNSCWAQTTSNYARPMNNFLSDQKGSRSDLWSQYHQNRAKNGATNDFVSSLIYFKATYGAVVIDTCLFNNIIGTSGSVLRVDDVISTNTWFIISSSVFNATFAYDSFANIMISKSSDPKFSSMLSCPYLQISDSTFSYTYGCPGAYGNILSLCYWDTLPSTKGSLSDYSLSTEGTILAAAWGLTPPDYARTRVTRSNFVNNLMSVSNSLAFIGAYFTLLQENVFTGNGGTTAGIAAQSLLNSYFILRYPTGAATTTSNIHFGQSTAVYLDHVVKFFTTKNTFIGNWGPWEGSMALATTVTIKNWINIVQSMQFTQDIFTQNQGIPPIYTQALSGTGLSANSYMDPLIGISLDIDGSTALSAIPALSNTLLSPKPTLINFQFVVFDSNILSFNYMQYIYNSGQLDWIKAYLLSSNTRYQTGLVKLLWSSEAVDDISNGFKSDPTLLNKAALSFNYGLFQNNQLKSMGCMVTSAAFVRFSRILNNEIYMDGETIVIFSTGQTYLIAPETKNQGFFCIGTTDFVGSVSRQRLLVDSSVVRNNRGIVINVFAITGVGLYLTNNIFTQNKCLSLGTIAARASTTVTEVNNIFSDNYNYMGNNYLYMTTKFSSVFNSYYSNNGRYASVAYLESVALAYECLTQTYFNDIYLDNTGTAGVAVPQSGLYFGSYSVLNIFSSIFRWNVAYSGIITIYGGTAAFTSCQILDHIINGNSVMGSFLAIATLQMTNVIFQNNTIVGNSVLVDTQPALICLLTAHIMFNNVVITQGTTTNNAMLVFGNVVGGTVDTMSISHYSRDKPGTPLLYVSFSSISFKNIDFHNVTGLFDVVASILLFDSVVISGLTNANSSQYLWAMSASTVYASRILYIGDPRDYSEAKPLISGDNSRLFLIASHFTDATGGSNSVISTKNTDRLFVIGCIFEFTQPSNDVTVFDLSLHALVVIQNNIITFAGTALSINTALHILIFTGNTIITDSHQQGVTVNAAKVYLISDNIMMGQVTVKHSSAPNNQIHITDTLTSSKFSRNTFMGLLGTNGILDIEAAKTPYQYDLLLNTFIGNTGMEGGALYMTAAAGPTNQGSSSSASITNCVFAANQALDYHQLELARGGAVYLATNDETFQSISFINTIFISNSVETIGGAIYIEYALPKIDAHCKFIANKAGTIENHIASYSVRLTLLDDSTSIDTVFKPGDSLPPFVTQQESYTWDDIVSGTVNTKAYRFALVDIFGQYAYYDSSSTLTIVPPVDLDGTSLAVPAPITSKGGIYLLEDFKFKYKVDETLKVAFSSSGVNTFSVQPVSGLAILPSINTKIIFQQCQAGQFVITEGSMSTCQSCPAGFWYIDPYKTATTCTACDLSSTICRGGNDVGPRQGYWRMNQTTSLVLACPRPESCIGNEDTAKILDPLGSCEANYKGNLCYSCIDGWAKDGNGNCTSCKTNAISYVLFILVISIQAILIGYGVKETMKEGAEYTEGQEELGNGVDSAVLLRIFMNYSQIFSLLVAIPIKWPSVLNDSLSISIKTSAIGDQLLSFDCFFYSNKSNITLRIIFFKALFIAANPFLFILLGLIVWVVYFKYKRRNILHNKDLINNIITTIVIICFDNQPTIIKNSFSMLQCMNLYREDTPVLYLVPDYDVKCWEGDHLLWTFALVVPCLVLWVVALPILMISILVRNKNALKTEEMAKKYSFIYNGYRTEKCYWEFSILIRKIILISVVIFGGLHSTQLQIYLFLIVMFVAYIFHVKNNPYSSPVLNELERVSLVSIIVFNLCGLYFDFIKDAVVFDKVTIIAGFFGGLFFLVFFGKLFFESQIEKLKQNKRVMKITSYLHNKFSFCLKSDKLRRVLTRAKTTLKWISAQKRITPDQSPTVSPICPDSNNISDFKLEGYSPSKTPQFSRPIDISESQATVFFNHERFAAESEAADSSRSFNLNTSAQRILPRNLNASLVIPKDSNFQEADEFSKVETFNVITLENNYAEHADIETVKLD